MAPWLNWIEQPPPKGQVTGSNPVGITILSMAYGFFRGLTSGSLNQSHRATLRQTCGFPQMAGQESGTGAEGDIRDRMAGTVSDFIHPHPRLSLDPGATPDFWGWRRHAGHRHHRASPGQIQELLPWICAAIW